MDIARLSHMDHLWFSLSPFGCTDSFLGEESLDYSGNSTPPLHMEAKRHFFSAFNLPLTKKKKHWRFVGVSENCQNIGELSELSNLENCRNFQRVGEFSENQIIVRAIVRVWENC